MGRSFSVIHLEIKMLNIVDSNSTFYPCSKFCGSMRFGYPSLHKPIGNGGFMATAGRYGVVTHFRESPYFRVAMGTYPQRFWRESAQSMAVFDFNIDSRCKFGRAGWIWLSVQLRFPEKGMALERAIRIRTLFCQKFCRVGRGLFSS